MKKIILSITLLICCYISKSQKLYSVNYESQADKKIYFVKYQSQADLKIYFVDYESQAKWKNNSKKHLLY
jgi:hypothetical protein